MAQQPAEGQGGKGKARTSSPDLAIVWMRADGSVWTNNDQTEAQAARLRAEAWTPSREEEEHRQGVDPRLQVIWIGRDLKVWSNMPA